MRRQPAQLSSLLTVSVVTLCLSAGCAQSAKRSIVKSSITNTGEPAYRTESTSPGDVIVEPAASDTASSGRAESAAYDTSTKVKTISFVDRHPLLRKPRQYYDNTNSNKAVKTASAAFVGVPAGFVGELKQIVVGQTPADLPAAH